MRRPVRMLGASILVVALAATGCSKNTGDDDDTDTEAATTQTAVLVDDATGPAPAVPGARRGGTVTIYTDGDFEHLDPQQNYVIPATTTGTNLLYRSLTTYRENGDGKLEVVGDLATNTGEESNGGKTWTFHLKDGLKYEDGTPITAQDVAYGIARSFSPDLPNGPHWFAQWLAGDGNYNKSYKGPYNGASKLPPGTTVPDAKTIVFNFPQPHADVPFAATLPTTSPVPQARDTKVAYDNRPFSSGPYKIQSYVRTQKLVLVRNPYWDPKTDPARHDYPDSYVVDFTRNAEQASNLLVADQGADRTALSFQDQTMPPSVYPKAVANPQSKARILRGPTQFVWYLDINTQRVKDKKVREALSYAINRQAALTAWGAYAGQPGTTILGPTTSGYTKYNAFDGGPTGDPDKAKELLGGKTVKLTYAYRNNPKNEAVAVALRSSLKKAGFDVTIQAVDEDQYYTQVQKKNNVFDFYLYGWGSDWPGGSTIIPALFDGRTILPEGNIDASYMNDPAVNKRIDEILAMSDLKEQDKAWAALDKQIIETNVPCVPMFYDVQTTMFGSKIGGIYLSQPYGNSGLNNLFVKA